jgi:hypothetical protein
MPARTCKKCGRKLPLQKGAHRPRLFCTTCHPPRTKAGKADDVEPVAMVSLPGSR